MDDKFLRLIDSMPTTKFTKNAINAEKFMTNEEKENLCKIKNLMEKKEYDKACNIIKQFIDTKPSIIPLLYRKAIFFIAYHLYNETNKNGVQTKVLEKVGVLKIEKDKIEKDKIEKQHIIKHHNAFQKWGMYPIETAKMRMHKRQDINIYRPGKKNETLCYVFNQIAWQVKHETFVDVFGGTGVITASKYKNSQEYINDLDEIMYNFLFMIKYRNEEFERICLNLIDEIELKCDTYILEKGEDVFDEIKSLDNIENKNSYSKEEVQYAVDLYKRFNEDLKVIKKKQKKKEKLNLNLDTAIAFYYISAFEKKGMPRVQGVTSDGLVKYKAGIKKIREYANRLKDVNILSKTFQEVIEIHNNIKTLLYLDPPYYGTTGYDKKFPKEYHEKLCNQLKNFKGKWILSCRKYPYTTMIETRTGQNKYDEQIEKFRWFFNQYKNVGKYVVTIIDDDINTIELMITNFRFSSIVKQGDEFDYNAEPKYICEEYNSFLEKWNENN